MASDKKTAQTESSGDSKVACFLSFRESVAGIALPERFTFPFYYEPHPLSIQAVREIQEGPLSEPGWEHNFGLVPDKPGTPVGKMFGVLVVQKQDGTLGYLAAYSGNLAGKNPDFPFVPPLFDLQQQDGFFKKEETVLNQLNREIEALEADPELKELEAVLNEERKLAEDRIQEKKTELKTDKARRKQVREEAAEQLSPEQLNALHDELILESLSQQRQLKEVIAYWNMRVEKAQAQLDEKRDKIQSLKTRRKQKSGALQQKLFDQYQFLNQSGEVKPLTAIFEKTVFGKPPSGAGECAAPKLLQYAFQHQLKPIAMAEFWWGQSPVSEVRKHGQYYPACRGKCEPILGHMLAGIDMDENPMLTPLTTDQEIEILYEDEYLLVINKPAELLSVPGKNVEDSVASRMKALYPQASGPLVVHRLDMATSGIMLIAKSMETHKALQHQFIKRSIKKRYVALLDGLVTEDEGFIDLPLRVDLDDRPRQLVCYEHGKPAQTKWKVIARNETQTRIHFYPITGRTHQLRVHAAHPLGLNTPIVGDDLYGTKSTRLHLHAAWISFKHPYTREQMEIEAPEPF
jgi:tRNA pseudouridine32 synthase/23S rRNA pseudouridine746 synthase